MDIWANNPTDNDTPHKLTPHTSFIPAPKSSPGPWPGHVQRQHASGLHGSALPPETTNTADPGEKGRHCRQERGGKELGCSHQVCMEVPRFLKRPTQLNQVRGVGTASRRGRQRKLEQNREWAVKSTRAEQGDWQGKRRNKQRAEYALTRESRKCTVHSENCLFTLPMRATIRSAKEREAH